MTQPETVLLFQSAKLGEIPHLLTELDQARQMIQQVLPIRRIYGVSGGALAALAFTLSLAARLEPEAWGGAGKAIEDFHAYLSRSRSRSIRKVNRNPFYGPYRLLPLRRWLAGWLKEACGRDDLLISEIPVPLYLCAIDNDAIFTMFGAPDDSRQFQYQFVRVGPPQDAPVLDALEAALSTMLSTSPVLVNGRWYRDCRPSVVDAGAIVADLEGIDPVNLRRTIPYTPVRKWKLNFITSSFIMHSQHERNQALLTGYSLDLLKRSRALKAILADLPALLLAPRPRSIHHVNLPYVGSTEASTNMRQSVENKDALMAKFTGLLQGQLDAVPFDAECNVIYGAGGFSGILAGLVTTSRMDAGFAARGGSIRQIYGVSAGVLNGFFHAVQVAAARHPDIYKLPARTALADLETFVASISPGKVVKMNLNPLRFWKGWAILSPFEAFIRERLAAYTGSAHPESITFDDIALPFTVAVADQDGFTDFLGMSIPERRMHFAGREVEVVSTPVIRSIIAGWSMNTYIQPVPLHGKVYQDGGGPFYDIGLFAACLDERLNHLINIHLDEPEGHSYNLPPRPNLVNIAFDTHNYTFPEERRRMFRLVNLLYEHYAGMDHARAVSQDQPGSAIDGTLLERLQPLLEDFRQDWRVEKGEEPTK